MIWRYMAAHEEKAMAISQIGGVSLDPGKNWCTCLCVLECLCTLRKMGSLKIQIAKTIKTTHQNRPGRLGALGQSFRQFGRFLGT